MKHYYDLYKKKYYLNISTDKFDIFEEYFGASIKLSSQEWEDSLEFETEDLKQIINYSSFEDIVNYSDNELNFKIEKLLKLKAFLSITHG